MTGFIIVCAYFKWMFSCLCFIINYNKTSLPLKSCQNSSKMLLNFYWYISGFFIRISIVDATYVIRMINIWGQSKKKDIWLPPPPSQKKPTGFDQKYKQKKTQNVTEPTPSIHHLSLPLPTATVCEWSLIG